MLQITYTKKFQKELKKAQKQGKDISKLKEVIDLLINSQELPLKNRDHKLTGNYSTCRECHLASDWLLIYEVIEERELMLYRLGSHSELF